MSSDDDDFEALSHRVWEVMPESAREDLRRLAVIVEPWLKAAMEQALTPSPLYLRIMKDRDERQSKNKR